MNNEVKIGLTIVIALVIAIIGFRFMQDIPIFRQGSMLHTHFERVDGISPGSPVVMNGVKIGSVREIILTERDSVYVTLNINFENGIPRGSLAVIQSVDLIGNKSVIIQRSDRTEPIPDGGYIEGHYDDGLMGAARTYGEQVGSQVMESTESLTSILKDLDRVMRDGGSRDVEEFLESLSRTTRNVDRLIIEKERELSQAISSLHNILSNVDTLSSGREEQIDALFASLESTSKRLDTITTELGGISSELSLTMRKINEGEGTLGKFVNDPSLYHNLDTLSYNLNNLIREMNENPRHFLKHVRLIDIF